ncbi:MAG TPA: IS1 family transposase [Rhizomicrobium sp.]
MNKLPPEKRAQVLHLLCEGSSMRAITRITGASKNAVARLLVTAGKACNEYQDRALVNLPCKRIQVDEIWAFTHCKQSTVATAKAAPRDAGDTWTWTAICADTKLMPSWYVGSRDTESAMMFMDDLAKRLASRVQLTSDGHRPYLEAVEGAFGGDIDYAILHKIYGQAPEGQRRYSPPTCIGAVGKRIEGKPDPRHISTSYVERANLTIRMHSRRFTRLTNAFSKKAENHAHAFALHAMYYNFVRIHQTLRVTPAMAAKVTAQLWEMSDIVAVIEAWESEHYRKLNTATLAARTETKALFS